MEMASLEDDRVSLFQSPESFTMARAVDEHGHHNPNSILKPLAPDFNHIAAANYGLFLGDTGRPARNLLEASSRRVAKHLEQNLKTQEAQAAASAASICQSFTLAYTTALRNGDTKWASAPAVAELFHSDAMLVTHDKQTYQGCTPILRRLNKGVENLMKMAGEKSEMTEQEAAECVTVSDPKEVKEGVWVVTYSTRWGIRQFGFEDTFYIDENKIKKLRRSRV